MKQKDVISELQKRYPDITQVVLEDIESVISGATVYQVGWIWRKFLEEYTYNSAPKPAVFAKLMKETPRKEIPEIAHGCLRCRISYPVEIAFCPICGEEMACVYKGKNYKHVNRHCSECEKFVYDKTFGAHCENWGVDIDSLGLQGEAKKMQLDMCRTCECQVCCRGERIFRQDFNLYQELEVKGDFKNGFKRRKVEKE